MPYHPYFFELSPLWVVQAALTVWMLVDANRRGVEPYWFWIILAAQPVGAWAYFFLHKAKDFSGGTGWLGNLFHRQPSLDELRHRAEQSPTMTNRLALGERLVKTGAHAEALPHLEAVLAREQEHCGALFLLAQAQQGLGRPNLAVPPLEALVARQPGWGDYEGWRALVGACRQAGDLAGAVARARDLARVSPTLEHRCLLAEHLLAAGDKPEARKVVEHALEEYRYLTGISRRRDRRWVGTAKQLLSQSV
jgi:hypothetical protein